MLIVLYDIVLYCIALHCIVLHCSVLYCTVCIVLYFCILLCCIVFYCIFSIVLHRLLKKFSFGYLNKWSFLNSINIDSTSLNYINWDYWLALPLSMSFRMSRPSFELFCLLPERQTEAKHWSWSTHLHMQIKIEKKLY
jgi:hypothetical protein